MFNMFMNGNGGVDNVWLNGFPFNDRLDYVVDVVVNVLTDDGVLGAGGLGWEDLLFISELRLVFCESSLDFFVFAVVFVSVFNWDDIVMMLLRVNHAVLNGLDVDLVVVLVNFSVDGSCYIFMLLWRNSLFNDGWLCLLLDINGVLISVMEEFRNGLFSTLHFCGNLYKIYDILNKG